MQGIPPRSDAPERIGCEIPKRFRSNSDWFPVIRNRELISTSREIPGIGTRLEAEAMKPLDPFPSSGDKQELD
jgi:hypothetical protein